MTYDLIILGGGPAGYNAAERAAENGLKTLCIERANLGGVCLNEGCIPTKTLLYSAKLLDGASHGDKYGLVLAPDVLGIDQKKVVARKNKVIRTLVAGIKVKLKAAGVEVVKASAVIEGRNEAGEFRIRACADPNSPSDADAVYETKNLLITTGSSPVMPPIPGAAEAVAVGSLMTNREILELTEVPEKLVIIGGGVIGLEMASYFNSVGAQVTVVEMLDHIAGECDRDLSAILKRNYEAKGVKFMLATRAKEFRGNVLICESEEAGEFELEFTKALMSVGRRANTQGLGLESIGLATERGAIVTDAQLRTNVPGVYAAGDVNGHSMLAHTAYREGEVAIATICGKADAINYSRIPAVIYTNPELGGIGYTEAQAQAAGLDCRVVTLNMRFSGRYLAENEGGDGIFKLIVDNATEKVLGAHALCNYSSEFIVSVGVMMEAGMTLEQIKKVVFPHPSVCEIVREAVFAE